MLIPVSKTRLKQNLAEMHIISFSSNCVKTVTQNFPAFFSLFFFYCLFVFCTIVYYKFTSIYLSSLRKLSQHFRYQVASHG